MTGSFSHHAANKKEPARSLKRVWRLYAGLGIHSFPHSLIFCEQKSDSLVKKSEWLPSLFCHERPETIAHGCSFVKSNGSESLKTLSEKEPMIGGSDLLLGIKRGKFVKNIQKYEFFKRFARSLQAICSFFASDSLESQANHSHRSFLKSNSLFCKE